MSRYIRFAYPLAIGVALVSLGAFRVNAQSASQFYAITNNDPVSAENSATIFKLTKSGLQNVKIINTDGDGRGGGPFAVTRLAIAQSGSEKCLFVSDGGSSDVASFTIPQLVHVGNYTDPEGNSNEFGYALALATSGKFLFAGYGVSSNIGVFQLGAGCTLTLQGTYAAAFSPLGMRATPDGKTLVVGYGNPVDSYAIAANGTLTEKGPFTSIGGAAGVDITQDGKYAIFGDITGGTTQLDVFPIKSDSSLGTDQTFGGDGSLGAGTDSSDVRISPNGLFIFVSNNLSKQVTSLGFSESPLGFTYVGITTLNNGAGIISVGGLTTASPSGNGGGIYVAEFSSPDGQVGLLKINSDGTTTEFSGSPYVTGTSSSLLSVISYPPRPF